MNIVAFGFRVLLALIIDCVTAQWDAVSTTLKKDIGFSIGNSKKFLFPLTGSVSKSNAIGFSKPGIPTGEKPPLDPNELWSLERISIKFKGSSTFT